MAEFEFDFSATGKTAEALKLFEFDDLKFSKDQLKDKYRILAMKWHPDRNHEKGAEEMFKKVSNAFSILEGFAHISGEFDEPQVIKVPSREMFDMTDVCPECKGTGQWIIQHNEIERCSCAKTEILRGGWFPIYTYKSMGVLEPCKACNGTGKFKLKSGRVVDCKSCEGKGTKKVVCKECNGKGYTEYHQRKINKCFKCEGKGRIELNLFNPVLGRGGILASFKVRKSA
jgi:DnaJ-class molecular chaperone